jgi:hypothetical protein
LLLELRCIFGPLFFRVGHVNEVWKPQFGGFRSRFSNRVLVCSRQQEQEGSGGVQARDRVGVGTEDTKQRPPTATGPLLSCAFGSLIGGVV